MHHPCIVYASKCSAPTENVGIVATSAPTAGPKMKPRHAKVLSLLVSWCAATAARQSRGTTARPPAGRRADALQQPADETIPRVPRRARRQARQRVHRRAGDREHAASPAPASCPPVGERAERDRADRLAILNATTTRKTLRAVEQRYNQAATIEKETPLNTFAKITPRTQLKGGVGCRSTPATPRHNLYAARHRGGASGQPRRTSAPGPRGCPAAGTRGRQGRAGPPPPRPPSAHPRINAHPRAGRHRLRRPRGSRRPAPLRRRRRETDHGSNWLDLCAAWRRRSGTWW